MDGESRVAVTVENGENHPEPVQQTQPTPPKIKRGFIRLRRDETCIQWGFRIIGGCDTGMNLQIIKVSPQSLAAKKGLRPGDIILKICGNIVKDMTNERAKMEILRAGNELDLVIERDFSKVPPKPAPKTKGRPKSYSSDQDLECFKCMVNPNLQSRSFRILQETLERLPPTEPTSPTVIENSPGDRNSGVYVENDTEWASPPSDGNYYSQDEIVPELHD